MDPSDTEAASLVGLFVGVSLVVDDIDAMPDEAFLRRHALGAALGAAALSCFKLRPQLLNRRMPQRPLELGAGLV